MNPESIRFMLFLRVLLRYLQRKDDDTDDSYERLKLALHDCATKSRRQERGYENLTIAMHRVIYEIVDEEYLAKARGYMKLFAQKSHLMHRLEAKASENFNP